MIKLKLDFLRIFTVKLVQTKFQEIDVMRNNNLLSYVPISKLADMVISVMTEDNFRYFVLGTLKSFHCKIV